MIRSVSGKPAGGDIDVSIIVDRVFEEEASIVVSHRDTIELVLAKACGKNFIIPPTDIEMRATKYIHHERFLSDGSEVIEKYYKDKEFQDFLERWVNEKEKRRIQFLIDSREKYEKMIALGAQANISSDEIVQALRCLNKLLDHLCEPPTVAVLTNVVEVLKLADQLIVMTAIQLLHKYFVLFESTRPIFRNLKIVSVAMDILERLEIPEGLTSADGAESEFDTQLVVLLFCSSIATEYSFSLNFVPHIKQIYSALLVAGGKHMNSELIRPRNVGQGFGLLYLIYSESHTCKELTQLNADGTITAADRIQFLMSQFSVHSSGIKNLSLFLTILIQYVNTFRGNEVHRSEAHHAMLGNHNGSIHAMALQEAKYIQTLLPNVTIHELSYHLKFKTGAGKDEMLKKSEVASFIIVLNEIFKDIVRIIFFWVRECLLVDFADDGEITKHLQSAMEVLNNLVAWNHASNELLEMCFIFTAQFLHRKDPAVNNIVMRSSFVRTFCNFIYHRMSTNHRKGIMCECIVLIASQMSQISIMRKEMKEACNGGMDIALCSNILLAQKENQVEIQGSAFAHLLGQTLVNLFEDNDRKLENYKFLLEMLWFESHCLHPYILRILWNKVHNLPKLRLQLLTEVNLIERISNCIRHKLISTKHSLSVVMAMKMASKFLWYLLYCPEVYENKETCDQIMRLFIAILRFHQSWQVEVWPIAMQVLWYIQANFRDMRYSMYNVGIIQILIQIFLSKSVNSKTRTIAASFFMNIFFSFFQNKDSDTAKYFGQFGKIANLIEFLKPWFSSSDLELRTFAATALARMTKLGDEAKRLIVKNDLLPLLIRYATQRHSERESELRIASLNCLLNLTTVTQIQSHIGAKKYISTLISSCRNIVRTSRHALDASCKLSSGLSGPNVTTTNIIFNLLACILENLSHNKDNRTHFYIEELQIQKERMEKLEEEKNEDNDKTDMLTPMPTGNIFKTPHHSRKKKGKRKTKIQDERRVTYSRPDVGFAGSDSNAKDSYISWFVYTFLFGDGASVNEKKLRHKSITFLTPEL
eukprot:g2672.t1